MGAHFQIRQVGYRIYVAGNRIENNLVTLSVTMAVNRIPRATLTFNYRDLLSGAKGDNVPLVKASSFDAQAVKESVEFTPGKEVSIELGRDNTFTEVFHGNVTQQRLEATNDGMVLLTVDCKHTAYKLTLNNRTRLHHHDANKKGSANEKIDKVSDLDALKSLLQESGTNLSLKVPAGFRETFDHENLIQYDCSDWDFLVMRAEALGLVCVTERDHIRLVKPELQQETSFELKLGENLLEYESQYSETEVAPVIGFSNWEIDNQSQTDETVTNKQASAKAIQSDVYVNHSGDISTGESKSWIDNLKARQEIGRKQGIAKTSGTVEVVPGDTASVVLTDLVIDEKAFVSGVKHVLQNGMWTSSIQLGLSPRLHAREYGITKSTQSLVPETNGMLFGKVIAYKTSEGGHELIEVEVAGSNEKAKAQTLYARLATLSAGSNGGAVFRPYPGDEVLIGFVQNDPRFPVILGSFYNSKNNAPFQLEDSKQEEVGFSINDWKVSIDEKNKKLSVVSPNGQCLLLDDQDKHISMIFNDENSIKINAEGIVMEASKIVLKAKNEVELSGMKLAAKATTSVSIEGGTQVEVEGKVATTIKGQITQIN